MSLNFNEGTGKIFGKVYFNSSSSGGCFKQSLAQCTVNAIGLSHPIVVTYLKSNIIKFYAVFHLEDYAENVVKQEMNHESGK